MVVVKPSFSPRLQAQGERKEFAMSHRSSNQPTRNLPTHPSLEQLKNQAKDLLKAFKKKDDDACAVLKRHSRFRGMADEDILKSEVTLQEVQHALALEYGFRNWTELRGHVLSPIRTEAESPVQVQPKAEPRDTLMRLLADSVRERCSDIHFEPVEGQIRVRYRIDGTLYEKQVLPQEHGKAVMMEAMRMAALDLTRDLPQDGRAIVDVSGKSIALFLNAMEGVQGPIVTIRGIDRSRRPMKLQELGFEEDQIEPYRRLIQQPTGQILITGPTGSGKTTLLYATLEELAHGDRKIMTAEDPVEFVLGGIDQVQIHPDKGLTFAKAVRNFLRQDVDIVMVAEIRDREIVEVLIQTALTGHMAFSTLHADDSPRALVRLLDMGIEPFLIRDTVRGVIAPRLVRCVCPACREKYEPTRLEWEQLGVAEADRGTPLVRGRGCDQCHKTGYRGRTCVMSLMEVGAQLKDAIGRRNLDGLIAAAREDGWQSLREVAIRKVLRGETTAAEVIRVT